MRNYDYELLAEWSFGAIVGVDSLGVVRVLFGAVNPQLAGTKCGLEGF